MVSLVEPSRCLRGALPQAAFLTSVATSGADVLAMMEVSRHKRVDPLQGYVRRANAFTLHACFGFL